MSAASESILSSSTLLRDTSVLEEVISTTASVVDALVAAVVDTVVVVVVVVVRAGAVTGILLGGGLRSRSMSYSPGRKESADLVVSHGGSGLGVVVAGDTLVSATHHTLHVAKHEVSSDGPSTAKMLPSIIYGYLSEWRLS